MPHRPTNFRSTVVKPFYIEKVPEESNHIEQPAQEQEEQVVQRSTRTENQEPGPEDQNPGSHDIPDQTNKKGPGSDHMIEPEPPKDKTPKEIEYNSDIIVI